MRQTTHTHTHTHAHTKLRYCGLKWNCAFGSPERESRRHADTRATEGSNICDPLRTLARAGASPVPLECGENGYEYATMPSPVNSFWCCNAKARLPRAPRCTAVLAIDLRLRSRAPAPAQRDIGRVVVRPAPAHPASLFCTLSAVSRLSPVPDGVACSRFSLIRAARRPQSVHGCCHTAGTCCGMLCSPVDVVFAPGRRYTTLSATTRRDQAQSSCAHSSLGSCTARGGSPKAHAQSVCGCEKCRSVVARAGCTAWDRCLAAFARGSAL